MEKQIQDVEEVKAQHGKDAALGYAAYIVNRDWMGMATSFERYSFGYEEAKKDYANSVHAGMLRR